MLAARAGSTIAVTRTYLTLNILPLHKQKLDLQTYLTYGILAYTFLVSFTRVWLWPVVKASVQPAELLFIPLGLAAMVHYGKKLIPERKLALPLLAYLLANLAAALASGQRTALLETLGRGYLLGMFLIVWTHVRTVGPTLQSRVMKIWQIGAAMLALLALAGYLLALLGWPNESVQVYRNYPYFGTVLRAVGLNGSGGMLVVVLLVPCLWSWYEWRNQGKSGAYLLLFLLVVCLSLSKEIVLLGLGLFLLEPRVQAMASWKKNLLIGVTATFFLLATHWIILPSGPIKSSYLGGTQYSTEKVVLQWGSIQVVESTYWALKRASWLIGWHNLPVGVGPGYFNAALEKLKKNGLYPAHLPNYDPHFTWGGAWAETGLLGFLALVYLSLRGRAQWLKAATPTSAVHQVLSIFLLLLLICSMSMDVMNFRHLWLVGALGLARPPVQ